MIATTTSTDGATTWTYQVTELGCGKDLSMWVLGTGSCPIASAAPAPYELVNPDPVTLLRGVKWEVNDDFSKGTFTITMAGATSSGLIRFATKAPDVAYGYVPGPVCP
jgi:hypothetical protein